MIESAANYVEQYDVERRREDCIVCQPVAISLAPEIAEKWSVVSASLYIRREWRREAFFLAFIPTALITFFPSYRLGKKEKTRVRGQGSVERGITRG